MREKKEENSKIKSCYGSKCPTCREVCDLKQCGINRYNEQKEERWQHMGFKSGGRTDLPFDESIATTILSDTIPEDVAENQQNIDVYKMAKLDALREFVFFYVEHPLEFEAKVKKIFLQMTQDDIAREEGITRSAISKRIKDEAHLRLKREIAVLREKNSFFLSLTGRELEIYQLLFVDGCTIRLVAQQLGISKTSVHRVGQRLRRKLSKSGTPRKNAEKIFLQTYK